MVEMLPGPRSMLPELTSSFGLVPPARVELAGVTDGESAAIAAVRVAADRYGLSKPTA